MNCRFILRGINEEILLQELWTYGDHPLQTHMIAFIYIYIYIYMRDIKSTIFLQQITGG